METRPTRFVEESEWQGTRDLAAMQFQTEHDGPRLRQQCHELLREARRGL